MKSLSISLLPLLAPAVAQAVPQTELSAVGGSQARSLLGQGAGVVIGILDGGVDANHPAIKGSIVAARDFSRSGTTDDDPGIGHSTGIASLYIGHAGDFKGLAPQAKLVNARVITSSDDTSDRMAGSGLFYSIQNGAHIINLSLGNRLGDGPLTSKFNLMVDHVADIYGASIVSAAGNDEETAVAQVPAGAFNGYSVGSLSTKFTRVSEFSNFAVSSDKRTKPDLVAPGEKIQRAAGNWETASDYSTGSGTSFSTPIVGGVLAQMIGYGKAHGLATDAHILKAITLTSADKVYDFGGDPWSARHQSTNKSGVLVIDRPLDDEQGAGRVDAVSAYQVYARQTDSGTPVANWGFTTLRKGRTYTMELGRLSAGQRVDSTLVWNHHVTRTDDGDGVMDADDGFKETAPLANFVLRLLKNGNEVARSDSAVDNLEHVSIDIRRSGRFSLQVFRYTTGGIKNERFALAARVLSNPPDLTAVTADVAFVPAMTTMTAGVSRSIPEADPASASVPEASTSLSGLLGLGALGTRRRRRRRRRA